MIRTVTCPICHCRFEVKVEELPHQVDLDECEKGDDDDGQ